MQDLTLNPNLLSLPIRKSGRPTEVLGQQHGLDSIIGLSTNENPLGPSPRAAETIKKAVGVVHRYPDTCETDLRTKIASILGPALDRENVIVANGPSDILRLLCQAFLYGGGEPR